MKQECNKCSIVGCKRIYFMSTIRMERAGLLRCFVPYNDRWNIKDLISSVKIYDSNHPAIGMLVRHI